MPLDEREKLSHLSGRLSRALPRSFQMSPQGPARKSISTSSRSITRNGQLSSAMSPSTTRTDPGWRGQRHAREDTSNRNTKRKGFSMCLEQSDQGRIGAVPGNVLCRCYSHSSNWKTDSVQRPGPLLARHSTISHLSDASRRRGFGITTMTRAPKT